jgi:hypothetical protein
MKLQINDKQRGSRRDTRARRNHKNFPVTDHNYHPTTETQVSSSTAWRTAKLPAFHKLSSEFLGGETSRHYVVELLFFVVLTGLAAWPIMSMLIAVIRMIRNY